MGGEEIMNINLATKVSLNRMKYNKMRTFLMVLSVAISIMSIAIIMAVSQGVKENIGKTLEKLGATDIIIITPASDEAMPGVDNTIATLTLDDQEAVHNRINGVNDTVATQIQFANVKYEKKSAATMILGTTPNWFSIRNWELVAGEKFSESNNNNMARVAVIGQTVAKNLYGETDPIGKQIMINQVPFTVVGMLAEKGASPDGDSDDRIIIPLNTFSKRVYNVTHLSQLIVQVQDVNKMKEMQQDIIPLLKNIHKIGPAEEDDFLVRIPSEVLEKKFGITGSFTILMLIIGLIVLIAGSIMVLNLMLTSVKERTSEIGLYKAVGATNKDIEGQFLIESLIVGILGGAFGVLLAIVLIGIAKLLFPFPLSLSWLALAIGLVFSILVGLITGILPARRAAKLNPVDALRVE